MCAAAEHGRQNLERAACLCNAALPRALKLPSRPKRPFCRLSRCLADTNLLYLLLDKLQPGQPVEAQSNAAEILAALAQSQVSPLTRNLAEPQFLELLVERALRHPAPAAAATAEAAAPATAGTSGAGPAVEAEPASSGADSAAAAGAGSNAATGEAQAAATASVSKDAKTAAAEAAPPAAARGDPAAGAAPGDLGSSNSSSAMMHAVSGAAALPFILESDPTAPQRGIALF